MPWVKNTHSTQYMYMIHFCGCKFFHSAKGIQFHDIVWKVCFISLKFMVRNQIFIVVYLLSYDKYRNHPKFSDRQAWANSADPDQTALLIRVNTVLNTILLDSLFYGRATLFKF